jgi:hypothetical protein
MRKTSSSRGTAFVFLLAASVLAAARCQGDVPFIRGDVDASRSVSVADALLVLHALFAEPPPLLSCRDAADANDSGFLEVADAVYLANFLFLHGPAPPAPFSSCAEDETSDDIDCAAFDRCGIDFYGLILDGDGIFYVIDRSPPHADRGELALAKAEIVRNLMSFPASFQFGVVFFDRGVLRFPASEQPATATPEVVASAASFVQSVNQSSGTCVQQGLVSALRMANRSTARRRLMVYVGDGGGTCSGDETDYLRQTVELVTAENSQGVIIHVVGVLLAGRQIHEEFLMELARRNGGTFIRVDR